MSQNALPKQPSRPVLPSDAGFCVAAVFPRDAERAGRGRVAWRDGSSTVPLEQIGQSAVKRLWRQKREFKVGHSD